MGCGKGDFIQDRVGVEKGQDKCAGAMGLGRYNVCRYHQLISLVKALKQEHGNLEAGGRNTPK